MARILWKLAELFSHNPAKKQTNKQTVNQTEVILVQKISIFNIFFLANVSILLDRTELTN